MAAETRQVAGITIGGKGSSLSSASVFAVANGLAQVRLDSSVLDRLSSNQSRHSTPPLHKFHFSVPEYLTLEETRASLSLLLNKLSLSSASPKSAVRSALPSLIAGVLNRGSASGLEEAVEVTGDELAVLEGPSAALGGACAVLDHRAAALSPVADAAAALSCEALRADVSAFGSLDKGDGFAAKDEIGVASDVKVLLNGSKFVGKFQSDAVSKIPNIHGSLREVSRSVHARTRVELNSSVVRAGIGESLETAFSPLASALKHLGKSSFCRAKLCLDVMGNGDLRSSLVELFDRECPNLDSLKGLSMSISQAALEEDFIKFLHEIYSLLEMVRKIVSWEAMVAFVVLEGVELIEVFRGNVPASAEINNENAKPEKKSEKKKKVLGKGTTVLVQLIKERLHCGASETVDSSSILEKWAKVFISTFNPKDEGFDALLRKVKDIVESNESRRLPKLPKGTRDFAKEEMAVREKAFSIITEVFKRHGAMSLDTPVFEMRETLMGKYGEDSKLIYDLADQGGELCSLRYDLTVPFSRFVAMNGIASFKRYQIAKVYRRDNPSKGRYREFYQCDFDIAGQYEKMGPDFEVVKILTELLDELNIGDYEVKLNHRKLLDGMLDICGVPPEKFRTICSSIDKLDKQSFEQIRKEMVEEKGLTVETADRIGTFVKERGPPLDILYKLKQEGSKFLEHNGSLAALNELEILFKALENSGCIDKVVFDLSLARGLDYYTGVIYEAVFKGTTQVGSIAAGGRYDNLIGMFGTKQVPAVGVSLGIERVFTIMEQLQKDRNQATRSTETQVLVSVLMDDLSLAAKLVSELWNAKVKAEFMVNKRIQKHIDRAIESRIPFVVLLGKDETDRGTVRLKDIEAKKEEEVSRDTIVEELQRRLNGTSP